jgi:hypothetical protein
MKKRQKAIKAEVVGGSRRLRRIAILIGIVAAVWALVPAAAMAEGEEDTGGFGAFRLKGTHGYSFLLLANSGPGFKHGQVLIFVVRKREAALYITPATVTATTIDAELGELGRISVEFEASGPPKKVRQSCAGQPFTSTFQPGAWVGTIDFRGEEGFTQVEASRASPFFNRLCAVTEESETFSPKLAGARLLARSATNREKIALQANENRPGGRLRVEARVEEKKHALTVVRVIENFYPGSGFSFDSELHSAHLRPPSPFSGEAAFRRDAKALNRWTGSLSVSFPGRANVPLTGSHFRATLIHARFKRTVRRSSARARSTLFALPTTKRSPIASAISLLHAPR